MRSRRRATAWIFPLAALCIAFAAAGASESSLDERDVALLGDPAGAPLSGAELVAATERVASLMRCPVCQGLSVADSHTPSALAMRVKAEALLEAGYSQDQVLGYFESSYGEFIRLAPRAEGFNLLVWFLPALGLLVGGFLVWRRLHRPGLAPAAGTASSEDDDLEAYRERVRREVRS